jgi:hypothetical protein
VLTSRELSRGRGSIPHLCNSASTRGSSPRSYSTGEDHFSMISAVRGSPLDRDSCESRAFSSAPFLDVCSLEQSCFCLTHQRVCWPMVWLMFQNVGAAVWQSIEKRGGLIYRRMYIFGTAIVPFIFVLFPFYGIFFGMRRTKGLNTEIVIINSSISKTNGKDDELQQVLVFISSVLCFLAVACNDLRYTYRDCCSY